ncbi:sugar ABC transporter permease [Ruegeria sp.]|uniref:carbohydrate ABC transporter permease n=1 Tax=Ruegeria sp. TaxID=1879320 RepID=UPI0023147901|nr:sugar ABC transporter permease [Ruegeria sp.]MDA7963639.1 sugar ABC transporter permease [Ruegeria sp.]
MAQKRNTAVPYGLVLPGFLFSAAIILWPLFQLGSLSFGDVNRFGQVLGFGGLKNYSAVFVDPELYASLWRTVIWTVSIVAGTFIIAMPTSIILHRDFYGRNIARVIIMLPWAISLAMLAITARLALNGESGMLNSALIFAGIIDENVAWLASYRTAFPMQIIVGILATIPFTTTIFLGGLSSIPQDLYEAAKMEGANGWQRFRRITLPMMRPFVNIAVVLNTIYVFNSFPIIWVTTQGGPVNTTDILVTYLYKSAFRFGKVGEAAVLSLIMFAILLIFSLIYVRLAMKNERGAQ